MRTCMLFIACLVLLLFSVSGNVCAQNDVMLSVGEKHEYKIKWLGMTVGALDIEVLREDVFQGKEVYVIEMRGGTNAFCSAIYRINDLFVTYMDKETLQPLKLEVSRREGFYKKDAVTLFFHDDGKAYFHNYLDKSSKEYPIPDNVYDIISVFFRLRTEDVQLNEVISFDVAFAETVFSASGTAEEKTSVKVSSGKKVDAYFAEPVARVGDEQVKDGSVRAYFSSDAYAIPLRVILKAPLFTKITMTLEESAAFV